MSSISQHNLFSEGMIPLSRAAGLVPSIRRMGGVSPSCIWRWIRHGIELPDGRIICLEAQRFCGRWVTSKQAIERFVAQQQPTSSGAETRLPDPPPTPAARRRHATLAEQELINAGL